MSTRKEKAQKASVERERRSYKLKPIQGDSVGDRMVREQLGKPAELSVSNIKTSGNTIDDKAIAMSQLGNPAELPNLEKRPTISDMLAPMREAAKQEKTDAQKMQKYYALSDVFNALGKMGGAAIGGAIGGNMLDSAPNVGEYKESRGYLDAFEMAKKASDRLRDLDEKEFQLSYSKKQRDEERAYNENVRAEDRKHRAALDKADKEWQKAMIDYKAKIEQAASVGNLKLKAQLEAEAQTAAWQHQLKRDAILHGYDMDEKQLSKEMVAMQMGGMYGKPVPFTFNNGSSISIPEKLNDEMLSYFAQKGEIGGVAVDADNVANVLRSHPNLVNDFLRMYGMGTTPTATTVNNTHMSNGTYNQPHAMKKEDYKNPEANRNGGKRNKKEDSDFDIFAYEVK